MKKNKMRVIQISGFRGILSAIFIVACLIAGFVGFPSIALEHGWNKLADITGTLPYINAFQGLILWGILAVSYMIINRKQRYLAVFEPKPRNPKEIRDIINEIKSQSAALKKEMPQTQEEKEEEKEVV
ncbi:MAG: hypothetical protein NC390_03055 [Fusobacterium sp.]|nr:hypothetical protein [Fusobacterium sp.]